MPVSSIPQVHPGGALPAARNFITQLVFEYLTENEDAHAKNFSVLKNVQGEWQPTRAYDLPSTFFYDDASMAMTLNAKSADFGSEHFVNLGVHLGSPERAVRRIINDMSELVDLWLPNIDELPITAAAKARFVHHANYRRTRIAA